MPDQQEPESLADEIVPPLAPPPTITREFEPAPWYRPRKQYLRKYQWNHEIVELIVKKRPARAAQNVLRVFGLPSSEFLDLLSMRGFCEQYGLKIVYLGFNASYARPEGADPPSAEGPSVDIYRELQTQRVIDASSFVHPSSSLMPDLFEQIRIPNSVSRNIVTRFGDFDVINLDLCGCIIRPEPDRAVDGLNALAELLNLQSTHRLAPWLLFLTTFASPQEINLPACLPLIQAIKENADDSEDFGKDLKSKAELDADAIMACFAKPEAGLPEINRFIRIFALAMSKWLAAKLRQPTPPSFVSMLPSYCFRHENIEEPHLLSLAYLIEPAPSPGPAGVSTAPAAPPDPMPKYRKHAKKIIGRCFDMHDLDHLMKENTEKRQEVADETEQLLIHCGFDAKAVRSFLRQYR